MKKISLVMLAVGLVFVPLSVKAQTVHSLQTDIDEIRRNLEIIQRRAYQENAALSMAPASAREIVMQMGQMNESFREVHGKIEELEHKIRQLEERINLINRDIDMRLSTVEGKARAAAAAPAPAAPAPRAPAPVATGAPNAITGGAVTAGNLGPVESSPAVRELYQRSLDALKARNYAEAEAGFMKILEENPRDSLAGNAQYWLGEVYYTQRDFERAAVAFGRGYRNYKECSKGPDNLLKLGLSMKALKKNAEACAAFVSLPTEFPRAPQNIKDRAAREVKALKCS
jgi:tol-pal system protein YbgF